MVPARRDRIVPTERFDRSDETFQGVKKTRTDKPHIFFSYLGNAPVVSDLNRADQS